jgi:AraC family transcriptional regulator, transcriptional activator of pobA
MEKPETLKEFYKRKFTWLPEDVRNDLGHFNVFRLEPLPASQVASIPYRRRDFYKIMLVKGDSCVHYADKTVEVKKQGLSFSNPQIPYKWEHLDQIREGVYCIFNNQFVTQFATINQYEVFQASGNHVFELPDDQCAVVESLFDKIEKEFKSEYKYKYDSIRNLIFELIHVGLKLQPAHADHQHVINASQRISAMFMELLERQFPIEDNHPKINLRSAAAFAEQLNVHVNHLNRAVKENTGKTTSQLIGERILQESKILLRHSRWNVSEIGFALGFAEVTHFNNFFKKHLKISPLKFRNEAF